jgi:penicillin-binding protein 1A
MLRAAVNRGTGRAARLPQANFGKTGTSQDNRDALFVGYANGLVVGVWIGNDDNTPLQGISGGGLPARIWRDFMTEASGKKAAPRPKKVVDPTGPVEPLDIPDIGDIPIGDRTRIGIEGNDAVITTEINGSRIDLRLPMSEGRPTIQEGRPPPEAATAPPPG